MIPPPRVQLAEPGSGLIRKEWWDAFTDLGNDPALYFNVVHYGAKLNGTANDLTAINAAMTAAQKAGGGVVFFPAGTALVDNTIIIPASNISVRGVGNASVVKLSGSVPLAILAGSALTGVTVADMAFNQGLLSNPSTTTWATATAYTVGQYVVQTSGLYYCLVAHTSGTFSTDLAAGKWLVPQPAVYFTSACVEARIARVHVSNVYTFGIALDASTGFIHDSSISRAVATGLFQNQSINITGSFNAVDNCVLVNSGMQASGDLISVTNNKTFGVKYGAGIVTGGGAGNSGKYTVLDNICEFGAGTDVDNTTVVGFELSGVSLVITGNIAVSNAGAGMVVFAENSIIAGNLLANNAVDNVAGNANRTGLAISNANAGTGTTGSGNLVIGNYLPSAGNQINGYVDSSAPAPANNELRDNLMTVAVINSTSTMGWKWLSFTPAVTAQAGTYTSVSATAQYIQTGKTVTMRYTVTVTTLGTAATASRISLPVSPIADGQNGSARDTTAGKALTSYTQSGLLAHQLYDASGIPPGSYTGTITYEAA